MEEDGESWLKRSKLYKRVVEPHKKKKNTHSESVFVAFGIHDKMRMRHIVICGCPALQYFPTLPHKGNKLKNIYIYIKYVS
jgi:hypothetical protein